MQGLREAKTPRRHGTATENSRFYSAGGVVDHQHKGVRQPRSFGEVPQIHHGGWEPSRVRPAQSAGKRTSERGEKREEGEGEKEREGEGEGKMNGERERERERERGRESKGDIEKGIVRESVKKESERERERENAR